MIHSVIAAATEWVSPQVDYHALAPEIILATGLCVVLLADLFLDESRKWIISSLTGFTLLGAMLPVLTLGLSETSVRSMFDGRYVVDEFSVVMKAMFLIAGYVVVLLSTKHVEEDEYWQGEYWFLLLSSILGMVMMTSSRDLVSIFVALEFLSIPAYMLAAWRKRDIKSNEAGMKYFLLGVFASAVMLYGMSLLFGAANSTLLVDLGKSITATGGLSALHALGIVFVIVGFAFKVSAVPFHSWAPDTYEGAPSPITAFLSVASKAAGFVALVTLLFVAFPQASGVWQPFMWVLSALTMTVGNVVALRQTNIVRMMAYSSISQGGFVHAVGSCRNVWSFIFGVALSCGVHVGVRSNEPWNVCCNHCGFSQNPQWRNFQLGRLVLLRTRLGNTCHHFPRIACLHSASWWLDR